MTTDAFTAALMWYSFLKDVTLLHWIFGYRSFERAPWPHLQNLKCRKKITFKQIVMY